MDLEVLINPAKAEGHPFEVFLVGFVYSSLAVVLSMLLFKDYASIVMISIAVVATAPLVHKIISFEANKDYEISSEYKLLKQHEKAVSVLTFLFVGFVFGFLLWFLVLSPLTVSHLFDAQTKTIVSINSATGNFISESGATLSIFLNNIRILAFSAIFSLFFGAGAILIMAWNASVMSAAIGSFVRDKLAIATGSTIAYFSSVSLGLGRYFLHGIPEIIAYFLAGLAGGIIYNAVIRKNLNKHIALDVVLLLGIATAIILGAAFVEVYVTPMIFS